ncbi:MAG: YfhO family protein [Verrucomicrobia bacterium]|nr:YfhO family protein [Verrucomicrobiota bacterium]
MSASSKSRKAAPPPAVDRPPWWRALVYGALVVAALLALSAVGQMFGSSSITDRLAGEGWGEYAQVIVRNRIGALWHGAFIFGCVAGFLFLLTARRPGWTPLRVILARWGLVAIMAVDALLLSRHYVSAMPLSAVQENEVIRLLKAGPPETRVALVTQESFYNNWLTYLFPYHGIKSVNITQMPRMPAEYQRFLQTVGRNPLRFWQLSAVGYVLAPAGVWNQMQNDPAMKEALTPALAYNVEWRDGDLVVLPATAYSPGQHVVLQFRKPAPFTALFAGWSVVSDDEALRRLADPATEPFVSLAVATESADDLPASDAQGLTGRAQVVGSHSGRLIVKVSSDRPAILRVAEKFDSGWRARINGKPAPVRRVDFLFMGVRVEPGEHEVELFYRAGARSLYVLALGLLVCIGAAASLAVGRMIAPLRRAGEETRG